MIEWKVKGDNATAQLGYLLILQVSINLRPGRVTYEASVEDCCGGMVVAFRGGLASQEEARIAAEQAARSLLQRGLDMLDNTRTLTTEQAVCSLCEPNQITETAPEKCWIAICGTHDRAVFWPKSTTVYEGNTDDVRADHRTE